MTREDKEILKNATKGFFKGLGTASKYIVKHTPDVYDFAKENIPKVVTTIAETKREIVDFTVDEYNEYKKAEQKDILNKKIQRLVNKKKIQDKKEALITAVKNNNYDEVIKALDSTNINYINKKGETALYIACIGNSIELIKLLLKNGANINEKFNNLSLLDIAIFNKYFDLAEFLIKNGIDIHYANNIGDFHSSYLMKIFIILLFKDINKLAVSNNIVNLCKYDEESSELLKVQLDLISDIKINHSELLQLSETEKNRLIKLLKLLIEYKVNVNYKDNKEGNTILMLAVQFNYFNFVKLFVENGAKINEKSNQGSTALILAVITNNYEITEYLIEKGADVNIYEIYDILTLAITYGTSNEIIKLLLENKVEISYNILSHAILMGNKEVIYLLIEYGVNVNETNYEFDDATPFLIASALGYDTILEILIDNGADLFKTTNNGYGAYKLAQYKNIKKAFSFINYEDINFLYDNINTSLQNYDKTLELLKEYNVHRSQFTRNIIKKFKKI